MPHPLKSVLTSKEKCSFLENTTKEPKVSIMELPTITYLFTSAVIMGDGGQANHTESYDIAFNLF